MSWVKHLNKNGIQSFDSHIKKGTSTIKSKDFSEKEGIVSPREKVKHEPIEPEQPKSTQPSDPNIIKEKRSKSLIGSITCLKWMFSKT